MNEIWLKSMICCCFPIYLRRGRVVGVKFREVKFAELSKAVNFYSITRISDSKQSVKLIYSIQLCNSLFLVLCSVSGRCERQNRNVESKFRGKLSGNVRKIKRSQLIDEINGKQQVNRESSPWVAHLKFSKLSVLFDWGQCGKYVMVEKHFRVGKVERFFVCDRAICLRTEQL